MEASDRQRHITAVAAKFVIFDGEIERSGEADADPVHWELAKALEARLGRPVEPELAINGVVSRRGDEISVETYPSNLPPDVAADVAKLLADAFPEFPDLSTTSGEEWNFE